MLICSLALSIAAAAIAVVAGGTGLWVLFAVMVAGFGRVVATCAVPQVRWTPGLLQVRTFVWSWRTVDWADVRGVSLTTLRMPVWMVVVERAAPGWMATTAVTRPAALRLRALLIRGCREAGHVDWDSCGVLHVGNRRPPATLSVDAERLVFRLCRDGRGPARSVDHAEVDRLHLAPTWGGDFRLEVQVGSQTLVYVTPSLAEVVEPLRKNDWTVEGSTRPA